LRGKTAIELAVLAPSEKSPAGAHARNMLLGAELAVREINEAGGVLGAGLRLARHDTGDMSPASVAEAVTQLLREGRTQAAVTGYASTSAFEAQALADARIPYLLAEHSLQLQQQIAANPERYATVWGLIPSYDPYGEEAAKELIQLAETAVPLSRRRAFLINSDGEYSSRCAEGLALGLERGRWSITGGLVTESGGVPDYDAVIREAGVAGADLIVSTDYPAANAAALARAFHRSKQRALLFIQYGPKYPEFLSLAGDAADGVVFNVLGGPIEALDLTQELRHRFYATYGDYPDRYGLDVYQAVHLYAEAASAVGSPWDTEAVGRHIGRLRREMTQGIVTFDPDTHLARTGDTPVPMQWFQYREGEKVCFAPEALATGPFEVPLSVGGGEGHPNTA
jgi:branched-chain amino acid transport system substrate-binding protein